MTQSGKPRIRIGQTRQARYEDFLKKHEWDKADWIAVPDPSRTYWDGTTVPAVGAREFTVLPSGIAIPTSAARGPVPIDLIQVFLTAEEVMDRRLGFSLAEWGVQQVRRDRLLTQTARLLGLCDQLTTMLKRHRNAVASADDCRQDHLCLAGSEAPLTAGW